MPKLAVAHAASIVQLAVGPKVYVVDLLLAVPRTTAALTGLLSDHTLKVGFDMRGDLLRVCACLPRPCRISRTLDLQTLAAKAFANPSLSEAARALGLPLKKQAVVRGSDWASRPLSAAQLAYAAADAGVLLQMYAKYRRSAIVCLSVSGICTLPLGRRFAGSQGGE